MERPSWSELTEDQQLHFGNGIGPDWMPAFARAFITGSASWFFQDASWRHHDFGYSLGYTEKHRAEYDRKFFDAMCRDALSQPGWRWINVPGALAIACLFYAAVRLGGWASFDYGERFHTVEEVLAEFA